MLISEHREINSLSKQNEHQIKCKAKLPSDSLLTTYRTDVQYDAFSEQSFFLLRKRVVIMEISREIKKSISIYLAWVAQYALIAEVLLKSL